MGSGYELANPRLGKPLRTYRRRALKFLEPGHQNLKFLFCFAVLLVIFDHSFTSITPWVRATAPLKGLVYRYRYLFEDYTGCNKEPDCSREFHLYVFPR